MNYKKLAIIICALFLISITGKTFADEIIKADGTVIPCKIETVLEGLIEYRQNGILNSFTRAGTSPVFKDYILVKNKLFDRKNVSKYYGRIIIKNMWNVRILVNGTSMDVPFFRIKFISIYNPDNTSDRFNIEKDFDYN